jgi:hypothetical protein
MEIKKTLLCVGGLMLATGGPITMFSAGNLVGDVKRSWSASSAATASQQPGAASTSALQAESPVSSSQGLPSPLVATSNPRADATPTTSLAEVLRFDVTVEWVLRRWPRVSTGLPHLQLQGYRVPVITGTSVADLAGSLTYYFNAAQQAQRITLRGTTGDPSALAAIVTGRYHFARRLTNDPGMVLYEAVDSGNQPTGSLKIRSAKVINANQPYARFEVEFEMNRTE